MNFFDKLSHFREAKESAKGNGSTIENNNESMISSSFGKEDRPFDWKEENKGGEFDPNPLSIKDLWQQAVEMHREKVEHTKAEEQGENIPLENHAEALLGEPILSVQQPTMEQSSDEEVSFKSTSAAEDKEFQKLLFHVAASAIQDENEQLSAEVPHIRFAASQNGQMDERKEPTLSPVNIQPIQTEGVAMRPLANEGRSIGEYHESSIQSLFDISPVALQEEMDQAIISIYAHTHQQLEEWFGFSLPEKELRQLKESKLGDAFQAIREVHADHGHISAHALQAAQQLLPLLWKGSLEKDYHIPQNWYETPLGYLFRYILSGTPPKTFDPIDASEAAAMLNWTVSEVIEKYPQLGGVKLGSGYVFSRQKVKECTLSRRENIPALTLDRLEEFYTHTKQGLTKLMRVSELMNEMYDELRYVRELLISGTDFTCNRIKLPIKMQVEQRLSQLYQKFKEMNECSFIAMPMNRRDVIGYTVPNVFQTLDQLGGTVINAEGLVRSLEESIQLVGNERENLLQLTSKLTSNLGQLSMDLELLQENLTGAKL